MKRTYVFVAPVTISLHVEVVAETLGEAVRKAKNSPVMGLCYQCARSRPGEWSTSGELDCDPADGGLSEVYVASDCSEGTLEEARRIWGEK